MIRTLPFTIITFDFRKTLTNMAVTLYQWQVRAEQRRHLGELDQYALDDIGISHGQAKAEACKPFFWI